MASGDKNYDIAKQTDQETILSVVNNTSTKVSNVGATNDAVGSSTTGSIFAKLNKIITDLTNHISAWTSTRAGKIDTIATDSADAKADAASNKSTLSTLSTTIGTINTNAARLTSTRAGYIDRLANSTYGLSALKTAIDKAASVSTTGVGTTLYSNTTTIALNAMSGSFLVSKFITPVTGYYKISITHAAPNSGSSYGWSYRIAVDDISYSIGTELNDSTTDMVNTFNSLTIGSKFSSALGGFTPATTTILFDSDSGSTTAKTNIGFVYLPAGKYVSIVGIQSNGQNNGGGKCSNVTVTYGSN